MDHFFDIQLAAKYGILEAVIIKHFQFWLAKNKANQTHFHDGRYWTYNSIDAFQKLFPYASYDQIRRALERLRKQGILLTGKYNKEKYNHTIWYSLSDDLCIDAEPYQEPRQNDLAKMPKHSGMVAKTITDIDTDRDNVSSLRSETSHSLIEPTTEKEDVSVTTIPYNPLSEKAKPKLDLSFIADEFREDYMAWLDYRKKINKPFKIQQSLELNYKKALESSNNDPKVFKQIIEQSIANGWVGLFELKTNSNGTTSSNNSRGTARAEQPEEKREPDYNFFHF